MNVQKLVIASHNPGKLKEYKGVFETYGITVTSAGALGLPEPEETGETFTENAVLKAKFVSTLTGDISMGDDGGLVIPALDGHPGIRSGRWAQEQGGFPNAHKELEKRLTDKPKQAHFQLVLALHNPQTDETCVYEGRCDGTLTFPPRGDQGFGYDPLFIPTGYDKTFAELGTMIKGEISHRAMALRALQQDLFK